MFSWGVSTNLQLDYDSMGFYGTMGLYGGFHGHRRYFVKCLVYFMENPNLKWMMTGGSPIEMETTIYRWNPLDGVIPIDYPHRSILCQ